MRVIRLYATGAASANNVANVTIPSSARLVGIQWSLNVDTVTDNGAGVFEVSQASATEIAVNGSQQAILELRYWCNLLTSGMVQGGQNGFAPLDVSLKQGQILYFHCQTASLTAYHFNGLLWLRD